MVAANRLLSILRSRDSQRASAMILLCTAVLKLATVYGFPKLKHVHDPIFVFVSTADLLTFVSFAELAVGWFVLLKPSTFGACWMMHTLAICMLMYRIGLFFIGHKDGCLCLGNPVTFGGLFKAYHMDYLSACMLAWILATSSASLWAHLKRLHISDHNARPGLN